MPQWQCGLGYTFFPLGEPGCVRLAMPHKPCRGLNGVRPQVRQPKHRYYAAGLEISQIDERCSYTHGTMFSGCVSTTCLHVVFILWFNTVMDDLISAVTHLRSALGDSQQAFANRLGLSFEVSPTTKKTDGQRAGCCTNSRILPMSTDRKISRECLPPRSPKK